jgi:exonuclease VII small subunit
MDKVQIEDIRYREKAYDKKTEKYEKTIRELEEKVKDLEKKLEYDRETNLGWKKLLEEEKNANEKNLKMIGELEKSLRDAECDIRKLNEKSHKTSYDVLEAEKERDYYKKRLEEVQKKMER